jgi:hypothetical protein
MSPPFSEASDQRSPPIPFDQQSLVAVFKLSAGTQQQRGARAGEQQGGPARDVALPADGSRRSVARSCAVPTRPVKHDRERRERALCAPDDC